MQYLKTFLSSLGMFTAIPMPQYDWDMEHGSRMTACLGLVGAVLGGLYALLFCLSALLPVPGLIRAILTLAACYGLTGFLHLDGFMDVSDALLSHRDAEGRRRILKDPHCGSFAVICLMLVLAANLAALFVLQEADLPWVVILCIPMLSRSIAGLLLLYHKTMPDSALGAYFKTGSSPAVKLLLYATLLLALAAARFFGSAMLCLTLALSLLPAFLLGLYAARRLDGVNGDVAGFTIVLSETLMLLALTVRL